MEVLFASRNLNKVAEAQQLFRDISVSFLSPSDRGIPASFDVEETGTTFEQNAQLKAEGFGVLAQCLTVADDSGLCVAALNNQPGVYSKRFVPGSDHDRNVHILSLLANQENRQAFFITVLALYDPATLKVGFFEGRVDGRIGQSEEGSAGFGYDPIFIPEGYDQSFAQLGPEVKNQLSHRARAFAKLKAYFQERKAG